MLIDLKDSVEAARARFANELASSWCTLVAADLAESVPDGADVYMLKHVLHGRRDAEAITILKNCCAVIPESGTLLVIEFVLPPQVSQADPDVERHLMSDLNMLAVTEAKNEASVNGEHFWKQQVFA